MGMEEVEGITIGLIAVGLICTGLVSGGLCLDNGRCSVWRRLMGAVGVILLASGFLCAVEGAANIDMEEVDEPVIVESRRIIEDGFDVQTVSSHTNGVLVMPDNTSIPTGSDRTDVRYIVMCEGDDGIETLDFSTSGVTVREDAGTWEDARLETVETAVERYTGTFFGVPVKDTKVEGRLWPDYVIHVPEGTLAEANGE